MESESLKAKLTIAFTAVFQNGLCPSLLQWPSLFSPIGGKLLQTCISFPAFIRCSQTLNGFSEAEALTIRPFSTPGGRPSRFSMVNNVLTLRLAAAKLGAAEARREVVA